MFDDVESITEMRLQLRLLPPPRRWLSRASAGRIARWAAGAAPGLLLGWAIAATGTFNAMVATLVVMGFSPDRGVLITAFLLEAIAAGIGTFAAGTRRLPALAGAVVFVAAYHHTFDSETRAALSSTGPIGAFDPIGWAVSLLTLVASVAVVGWAVTTLVRLARGAAIAAAGDVRTYGRAPRNPRVLARPAAVIAVVAVLAVTLPTLGDMLNFEPDVHMRHAGGDVPAVTGAAPLPSISGGLDNGVLENGGVVASPEPGSGVLSATRPWLAAVPSGPGSVTHVDMPAPWGPIGATIGVSVYLPPGYAPTTGRDPVLYLVPHSLEYWNHGVQIVATLDALIDSGEIPPTIVVFASETGGPYADSECANSADGREWFDSWFVQTLVPRIDSTFRTIASPTARAVMGYSQGGFCATSIVTRHPDVFATAISFSGYFEAGVRSSETPNAWRPYGADPSYEAEYSPAELASQIAPSLRPRMFFELSSSATESFFAPQYAMFAAALERAGIPESLFPTPLGHAWAAVRAQLPTILETWAARMTALAVFVS